MNAWISSSGRKNEKMEAKHLQVEGRGVGRGIRGVAVGFCKQLRERHQIKSKLSLAPLQTPDSRLQW
jgi:hypothetical protein